MTHDECTLRGGEGFNKREKEFERCEWVCLCLPLSLYIYTGWDELTMVCWEREDGEKG